MIQKRYFPCCYRFVRSPNITITNLKLSARVRCLEERVLPHGGDPTRCSSQLLSPWL